MTSRKNNRDNAEWRNEWNINRRTVLRSAAAASGVGLAGLSGFSGAAVATEEDASDPCEGCGSLLTKYEWEDGEFVWEKGRETLGINGDEFDITVTETNDDGEPLCIEVESIKHRDTGDYIYDFSCSTVKSGQDVDEATYDWASSFEHCQEKYAISNFVLCIEEVFWQWDWGTGPFVDLNTEDPDDRTWYQANPNDPRHLLAANQSGGDLASPPAVQFEDLAGLVENVVYTRVDASTLRIDFDVVGDDSLDLHLFSQELPGPAGDNSEIPWGPTYDVTEGTFSGTGNSMTVDLPTL